ncbi:MAG: DNA replication protein [Rhodospirillaceae bacterium]|nr:DNA replication protein [Rhodospirillaceae bacterium]MBT4588608.1 DNA replication protein [Rhodospirillaceae bacterium]MBT5941636.1 DNA replication protein [Rhodospirillaceae bacterium]MBT7266287.1 DNA replication protein [Rhodospirillaceae bacterium]
MSSGEQLPFEFDHRPSLSGEDFLVAPCNQEAVAWLDKWPDWPAPFLVIYGPAGCGKTHLSHVFMAKSGALQLTSAMMSDAGLPSLLSSSDNFVADDGDVIFGRDFDEEALFHIYNDLSSRGGHMLITASRPPNDWQIKLADLASRIKAAPAIGIGMPEDDLIKAVLVKLFSDRQLRVEIGVIDYVAKRMERSLDAARQFVKFADKAALVEKKGITLPLARDVLTDIEG